MQKFVALAVAGMTLMFAASAALADNRSDPALQPDQGQTVTTQDGSIQPAVTDAPAPQVSDKGEGSNQ